MEIYYDNIEVSTKENTSYRKVVYTLPDRFQIVLMSLKPGEEIGLDF